MQILTYTHSELEDARVRDRNVQGYWTYKSQDKVNQFYEDSIDKDKPDLSPGACLHLETGPRKEQAKNSKQPLVMRKKYNVLETNAK